jgi:hypothetical protein
LKIKKIQTYEQITLTGLDGKKVSNQSGRLSNVFAEPQYKLKLSKLAPGVIIESAQEVEEKPTQFFIPWTNIPYAITEEEQDDLERSENRATIRNRRGRKSKLSAKPVEEVQESGGSKEEQPAPDDDSSGHTKEQVSDGVFPDSNSLGF